MLKTNKYQWKDAVTDLQRIDKIIMHYNLLDCIKIDLPFRNGEYYGNRQEYIKNIKHRMRLIKSDYKKAIWNIEKRINPQRSYYSKYLVYKARFEEVWEQLALMTQDIKDGNFKIARDRYANARYILSYRIY